jgi:SAM-dependent methyltransferase
MSESDKSSPRILMAIASHGTGQDHFLKKVVGEYRKLPTHVRVVVLSNLDKPVEGAEVLVGLPSPDPYSLPFAHRKLFVENVEDYDLFIYAEDDTLFTGNHIEAFFEAQSKLRADEIPGFIRSEISPEGETFITSIHHHFRWIPGSVVERGGELFARLSNEHSGGFMVTRKQLKKAIASGGFMVSPHAEKYGMLETAASDLYTQCGFRRLMCLSRIKEFIVRHLADKYYEHMGITLDELECQVEALMDVGEEGAWRGKLYDPVSGAPGFRWSANLYKDLDIGFLGTIPAGARRVLSVGCGYGENEEYLVREGLNVCVVPIDTVFGASLRRRGLRTVDGAFGKVVKELADERFDVVVLDRVLHLVEEPVEWLRGLRGVMSDDGVLVASVANTSEWPARWRDRRAGRKCCGTEGFAERGVQPVSIGRLREWCRESGLEVGEITPVFEDGRRVLRKWPFEVLGRAFAQRFILKARKGDV